MVLALKVVQRISFDIYYTQKKNYYLYSYLLPRISFPSSYAMLCTGRQKGVDNRPLCCFGDLLYSFLPHFSKRLFLKDSLRWLQLSNFPSVLISSVSFRVSS